MKPNIKPAREAKIKPTKEQKAATKKKLVASEKTVRAQVSETRQSIQQALPQPRKDAVIDDPNHRSDGRSVSIGTGGVVTSLGAHALTKEEIAEAKESDKAASRLENLYARTYTDVLLATGKTSGWTDEEQEKARKHARIQFKAALPRVGPGQQRDIFIACVTAGIALEVFGGKEASQLLYAAQVMATGRKPR